MTEDWRVSVVGEQHGLVHLHQEVLHLVGVVCVHGAVAVEGKGGVVGRRKGTSEEQEKGW